MSTDVPDQQAAFLARHCLSIIGGILDDLGVTADINNDALLDCTEFFLRDIYRLDRQQRGSVSLAKYAGYWAFWIRKIKPLANANPTGETGFTNDDAIRINEIVAIRLALELVVVIREKGIFQDHVRENCLLVKSHQCNGVRCFLSFSKKYLEFNDEFYHKYLIYSMRHRTFGPHHFALLIENMVFAACEGISSPNGAADVSR